MAPFDRSHTSSYVRSVVTMAPSCIISQIKPEFVESRDFFYTPPAFDGLVRGSRPNIFKKVKRFEDYLNAAAAQQQHLNNLQTFHLLENIRTRPPN